MKALRVIISGRVHGVWFRGWTIETARHHGLDGWVRNRADGTDEAVFAGADHDVDDMIEACRHGPPMARVVNVESFPHDQAVEPGFHSRPSG
jgi:acylphosphatase